MHIDPSPSPATAPNGVPWYQELTRYHLFVFIVAALGWLADCMDQQLFNLARAPAIAELRGTRVDLQFFGGLATSIFMIGWATGGIIFGIMGDRVGRAKTMLVTILVYSIFTGLSALSTSFWDFAIYRFLTGLGVGGEFAVGVALIAEVMPDRVRPHALGFLQACSAIGNVTAAFIGMGLAPFEAAGMLGDWKPWRYMFVIGALPALLAILIRRRLKEPQRWQDMRNNLQPGQKLGSLAEMFSNPTLRRNAIVGLILATSGVVGLWGIGFFGFDLARSVFREHYETEARTLEAIENDRNFVRGILQGSKSDRDEIRKNIQSGNLIDHDSRAIFAAFLKITATNQEPTPSALADELQTRGSKITPSQLTEVFFSTSFDPTSVKATQVTIETRSRQIEGDLTWWTGMYGLAFNFGAFFGVNAFSFITHFIGRRPTFAVTFVLSLVTTAFAFANLNDFSDIFWMVPIMGFFQIGVFGGYAIYFPELFPTRLRATGTSFCYNVGRYLAAAGPLMLGILASAIFGHLGEVQSLRYAGIAMCACFLFGLAVLPWAPETRGKPLPE